MLSTSAVKADIGVAVLVAQQQKQAPIVGWVANQCGPRWALGVGAASGFAAAAVAMLTRQTPLQRSNGAYQEAQ